MYRILLIDDEPGARAAADAALRSLGHDVVAVDASAATALLAERGFDVVVAGLDSVHPPEDAPARAAPRELVCLPRPLVSAAVVDAVRDLEQRGELTRTLGDAERTLSGQLAASIIGSSAAIRATLARAAAVATSDAPVLLTGESGTGKELLARAIHARSRRSAGPLVAVNCAAFPDSLIEAELFGHERGAFTGAHARRDGTFKAADGGTLFLDEVNGLSPAAQAKLLRVLQDGTFHPVGSTAEVAVDVRIVSATNCELHALVATGAFREDLYFRLKVLDLDVPALRDRSGDLPLLVAHFLRKHAPVGSHAGLSPQAWAALCQHPFPGNVRELEHAIQHAVVLAGGFEIELEHLPRDISAIHEVPTLARTGELRPLATAVAEFEHQYLLRALELACGNKSRAARMLGVSRKHLWEKLRRHKP